MGALSRGDLAVRRIAVSSHSSLLYPSSPAADVCYKKEKKGGKNPTLPKCHGNAHWRAVSAAHLICMTGSD